MGNSSKITRLYHRGSQCSRGCFIIPLLQSFFLPLLNDDLVFHLLPPARFFSNMMRERTHPQLNDLARRCRKLIAVVGKPPRTVLRCSFPRFGPHTHSSECWKGCSNPSSGSWIGCPCSDCLGIGLRFDMAVAVGC